MTRQKQLDRYKLRHFIVLTFVFSIIFVPPLSNADTDSERKSVSIDVVDEPLNLVFDRISEASGYEIVYDEEWGNLPVSLSFENEPIDRALNRVLANLNHAVVWNEEERRISIFISGKSSSKKSASSRSSRAQRQGYPDTGTKSSSGGYGSTPTYTPQTEPYRRSKKTRRLPEGMSVQPDPNVSVTGGDTSFEQVTSTIE